MLMRSAATLSGRKRKLGKSQFERCIAMHFLQFERSSLIVANFNGMAREFGAQWLTDHHSSLKTKASRKHGKEYSKARARYPSPEN